MARTAFTPLTDSDGSAYYPDSNGGLQAADDQVSGNDRYGKAGLLEGENQWQFPLINDDFNVPFIQFKFLDAFGNVFSQQRAPLLRVRMPNQFNISSFSEYARTDNVFGAGNTLLKTQNDAAYGQAQSQEGFDMSLLAKSGLSAAEAFQTGLARQLAGVQGFLQSGGMNNIAQFEFTQRKALNPFAQLLYKGPQNRKYQIPVIMRPRSPEEAKHIRKIIHTFRVASSASVPYVDGKLRFSYGSAGFEKDIGIGDGSTFTYGYPHLTQFDIVFLSENNETKLFRSKACVIDSVAVDYGGQKLTFFEDGNVTETQLTIQLTEIIPRTLGDARLESLNKNFTMV